MSFEEKLRAVIDQDLVTQDPAKMRLLIQLSIELMDRMKQAHGEGSLSFAEYRAFAELCFQSLVEAGKKPNLRLVKKS